MIRNDDSEPIVHKKLRSGILVNPTPNVSTTRLMLSFQDDREKQVERYFPSKPEIETKKRLLTGQVNVHFTSDYHFDENYHNFISQGYAFDPALEGTSVVVN